MDLIILSLWILYYSMAIKIISYEMVLEKRVKRKKNLTLPYIILTIPFFKQKPFFKSIKLISTSSKKYNISLKALKLISNSLRSSFAILSTPYGVITHTEAIRLKTGGLLLCVVH